ncbi:hypothetical protein IQ260_21775 [Leptolyngbya cf. ectocarpi LEGE 11479]|uniref:Uncharacterized protein n=1 Tax=Leptolyngbya cf. ectocarpi LEGE 11479 TaxID=1828722 RepID=A0A929F9B6_LEPEC|nr:hypothetical protein [Leptolyngbya ectocarpi]MBE9069276.1 hypothetical protein [Leptolyngbya cf. ectocarpi LEGE 11479]
MKRLGGPVNVKDIPQERLDKIVDLLCEDNRADAMLLYCQTATVELETAWAVIQDILIDLGEDSANLPKRAVDDDAYLEAQYYAKWCLTESRNSERISEGVIGKCTFKQLPQRYQDLFTIGPNRIKKLKFFPEKDIVCMVLITMPVLFMWSTVPFLGIFSDFPLMWAWNTWPRVLFMLMVLIVCIPPPIMGIYTVRMLQVMAEFLRKKKAGAHIYGLVIDGQNVVGRQLSVFEQKKNCLFLPRNRITNFATKGGSRVSTAKFFIQFINHQDQRQWLMLESGSSYSLKPYQLYQIFQREKVSQG